MKRLATILLLIVLSACCTTAVAQTKPAAVVVNGKVTSFEESLPLEGVGIVVKGTANATGTQADGTFSLLVVPGDTLLISLAGYHPMEIKTVVQKNQYDVVLRRSDNNIPGAGNNDSGRLSPVMLDSADR